MLPVINKVLKGSFDMNKNLNSNKSGNSSITITKNAHDTVRALAMVKGKPTIKQYINDLMVNEINNLDAQDYQNFRLLFQLIKSQRK